MKRLAPNQLGLLFDGHLGLIVGPGLTLGTGALNSVNEAFADGFGVAVGENFLATADAAIRAGASLQAVVVELRRLFGALPPAPLPPRLAHLHLRAVLSYCPTSLLEDALRAHNDKSLFRFPLITLDDPAVAIPPRSTPMFKVLGSLQRETFIPTNLDYVRNRPRWRSALRAFMEQVKNGPVLCIGMTELASLFHDLVAELGSTPATVPKNFVLLESDPLAGSDLDRLFDARTTIITVPGTAGDLVRAAESQTLTQHEHIKPTGAIPSEQEIDGFSDLAIRVNGQLRSNISDKERQRLFEILFSPTVPKWDPFFHRVDFERSISATIKADILTTLSRGGDLACVITGAAATGKTVILKRIAYDLANDGHLVLWMRQYYYPDAYNRMLALFKVAGRVSKKPQFFVFLDDPLGLGSVQARDIAHAARASDVNLVLVVGVRTSDWTSQAPGDLLGPVKLGLQTEVDHHFDDHEWERLPAYLVKLGIARDHTDAREQLDRAASRSARDVLSMLYWLIPNTRAAIEASVQGEYFRLGDLAAFKEVVLGHAKHSSALLRDAYAMVAVADKYNAPVPVEVLVSALKVDYGSWLEVASPSKQLAWGLLYAEDNIEGRTIVYRTRNDVVTHLLVEAVNGGSLVQGGELRTLERMIDSCDSTHPVYLEFCQRLLINNETFWKLSFEDGLALYDRALSALPLPDKSLLHQKGKWIRTKGNDPIRAEAVFHQALLTPVIPYARRGEADEHIYTSLAASAIDAMEKGAISTEIGKEKALSALARARSDSFFNVSAVHVNATLTIRLAERIGDASPDGSKLFATALADVDRTILLVQARATSERTEDITMLADVREKLVTRLASVEELVARAQASWTTFGNQEGFALAGRAMLFHARQTARGRDFREALEYVTKVIKAVEQTGKRPIAALHDLYVQTMYEWRIRGYRERPNSGPIDWEAFHTHVVHLLAQESSPLYRYFEALSLAHLNRWQEADLGFSRLRQLKMPGPVVWARRDPLLDSRGALREVQCTVRRENQKVFLTADELGTDLRGDRDHTWPRDGEIVLVCLLFSFGGTWAIPSAAAK